MKRKKDESLDDYSTINEKNNFFISDSKNYKIIIISFLIIIIIMYSYLNNKFSNLKNFLETIIKNQDVSIKKISDETSLLKRQIEALFLYLNNFRNKSSIMKMKYFLHFFYLIYLSVIKTKRSFWEKKNKNWFIERWGIRSFE